jgi:hypothetical protein
LRRGATDRRTAALAIQLIKPADKGSPSVLQIVGVVCSAGLEAAGKLKPVCGFGLFGLYSSADAILS